MRCSRTRSGVPLASVSPPREGDAARRELEVPDEPVQRPDLDAAHEVIERLEWADGKQEDTPHKRWRDMSRRTALTGGAAGVAAFILNACGGGKKTTSTGTTAAAAAGTPAAGVFGSQPKLQVRARQPRHDEPVLRADAVRRRGRVQAAGLQLPVDGLAEQQRQRDGQRVQQRDHRAARTASGCAWSTCKAFNGPTDKALAAKIPVVGLQRRRRRQRRGWPTSARTCSSRASEMGEHIVELVPVRRRGAVHRHAGLAEHPAAHRRRAGHDQEVGQGRSRRT